MSAERWVPMSNVHRGDVIRVEGNDHVVRGKSVRGRIVELSTHRMGHGNAFVQRMIDNWIEMIERRPSSTEAGS